MSKLSFSPLLALASLVLVAPACSSAASTSDTDSTDSDLHVKPVDSENLGRVLVSTPAGWVLPVNPQDDATAQYRGTTAPFNVAQRLKEGAGIFTVYSKFDVGLNSSNVNVVKGTQTELALGSIKAAYDPNATLKRDFGPKPQLKIYYTASGAPEVLAYTLPDGASAGNAAFWAGTPARAALAPPGAYRFSFGLPILADQTKSLANGENATPSLTPTDQRATITIKKPASRDLPDVPVQQCHVAAQSMLVQRSVDNSVGTYGEVPSYDQRLNVGVQGALINGQVVYGSSEGVVAWAGLPLAADTTVKVFPFAASEGAMHYELVVNNVAVPIALTPGATKTIQLERLDIDDVAVTKETGEVYNVKGTWQLFRQGPAASWIPITVRHDCSNGASTAVSYGTGTGVDVLPGTYRVLISYTTAEGAKTQDQTVTVP